MILGSLILEQVIICDVKFLHDLRLLDTPIHVSLPNGQKVQVTQYGTLKLNDWIELHHVLLVPHFKYNLLSVKQLARQLHCDVVFSETLCTLQDPSLKRPVVVGKEAFGLYLLEKNQVKGVLTLLLCVMIHLFWVNLSILLVIKALGASVLIFGIEG